MWSDLQADRPEPELLNLNEVLAHVLALVQAKPASGRWTSRWSWHPTSQ
jgi:hypothetical protein